jgi:methionyl aminopeptidase
VATILPQYFISPPGAVAEVKDAETIAKMRVAGAIAAQAMATAAAAIAPGRHRPTNSTPGRAHEFLLDHGGLPLDLGLPRVPQVDVHLVNEVVCHGIPDDRRLEDGDIVNIDITAFIDGVHGDTDATYRRRRVDEESRLLIERTHEAMMRGIKAAAPGRRSTSSAG